jgi:23S rRNA pseudouridine1911/1915/1917 synthase
VDEETFVFSFQGPRPRRLDLYLVESLPKYSRSRLQGLIRDGLVRVDGASATKAGQMASPGAVIEVRVPATASAVLVAERVALDVIFENDDVLVVNKPAGMVVHPAAGHASGTLVNAVLGHDPSMEGIGGEERPGVVHRLDKATSGLIMLAKNDRSLHWLQEQFRARKVDKSYLALVDGKPPTPSGRIEAAIGRDPGHRKRMAVVPTGKGREASSDYRTLESFEHHTLLEFHPITGRTHQVRLHCAFLGCPIVGDEVYGRKKPSILLGRHFLHAQKLSILLPDRTEPAVFQAPLPADLMQVLATLRTGIPG